MFIFQFAQRAKTVRNAPVVNELLSDEAQIHKLRKEVAKLKAELNAVNSLELFI